MSGKKRQVRNSPYLQAKVVGIDPGKIQEGSPLESLPQGPLPEMDDKAFNELCQSIMVVILYRGQEGIHVGICEHFPRWGRMGWRLGFIRDPHGGFIEVARSGVAKFFLDTAKSFPELKYLVTIDNDQGIQWDAPIRLAAWGMPVVSGVVCGYAPERGVFACFTAKDENGVPRFPSWRDTKMIPSSGLIEAEQVGGGLVCIRRDVLETIMENGEQPYFVPESSRIQGLEEGTVKKGEDICFSERCKKYGFKRYVDFSVHAMHYKTIGLAWPDNQIDENLDAIHWNPSKFDYKGVL